MSKLIIFLFTSYCVYKMSKYFILIALVLVFAFLIACTFIQFFGSKEEIKEMNKIIGL